MTVEFWSGFSKRINSTAQPSASAALILDCKLKDQSGVLHPALEIYQSAAWNPSSYNYARILSFGRYYFVSEWAWVLGRWECTLQVDAMASWKTDIGAMTKYIVRASYDYDSRIADTFYPPLALEPYYYYDTADFAFDQDFAYGMYVLGVANREGTGAGAITYYTLTSSQIRALVQYMLVTPTDVWTQGFSGLTDVLYRSFYSPFDYIKTCRWFPFTFAALNTVNIKFGNYESTATGAILNSDAEYWLTDSRVLNLPTNWLNQDAKYRVSPYAHLYLVMNPWGVIELNPMDLSDSTQLKIRIFPDLISGDCLMKVYKIVNSTERIICQQTAKISVDINLSASSFDLGGILRGGTAIAGGIGAAVATGGASAIIGGALAAAAGVNEAVNAATPSMSNSIGQTAGGARAMEGIATLIYTHVLFTGEDNSEFGRPLMRSGLLSAHPGYIKCLDGELISSCWPEEKEVISGYMIGGFFYE